jgi:hypothetical protein
VEWCMRQMAAREPSAGTPSSAAAPRGMLRGCSIRRSEGGSGRGSYLAPSGGRGSCLGLRTGVSPHFSTNSKREMLADHERGAASPPSSPMPDLWGCTLTRPRSHTDCARPTLSDAVALARSPPARTAANLRRAPLRRGGGVHAAAAEQPTPPDRPAPASTGGRGRDGGGGPRAHGRGGDFGAATLAPPAGGGGGPSDH